MTEKIIALKENDTISIVPPKSIEYDFTGDYSVYVYRLRKYSSEHPLIIEIDDDEVYVLSDDDEQNGVIILDPVDKQAEHDLGMQLSREFNAEIKQELQDIDEFETYCKEVKKEPFNFFEIETSDADLNQQPSESSPPMDNRKRKEQNDEVASSYPSSGGPCMRTRSNNKAKKSRVSFVDLSENSDEEGVTDVCNIDSGPDLQNIKLQLSSEVRTRKQARFIKDAVDG